MSVFSFSLLSIFFILLWLLLFFWSSKVYHTESSANNHLGVVCTNSRVKKIDKLLCCSSFPLSDQTWKLNVAGPPSGFLRQGSKNRSHFFFTKQTSIQAFCDSTNHKKEKSMEVEKSKADRKTKKSQLSMEPKRERKTKKTPTPKALSPPKELIQLVMQAKHFFQERCKKFSLASGMSIDFVTKMYIALSSVTLDKEGNMNENGALFTHTVDTSIPHESIRWLYEHFFDIILLQTVEMDNRPIAEEFISEHRKSIDLYKDHVFCMLMHLLRLALEIPTKMFPPTKEEFDFLRAEIHNKFEQLLKERAAYLLRLGIVEPPEPEVVYLNSEDDVDADEIESVDALVEKEATSATSRIKVDACITIKPTEQRPSLLF